MRPCVPSFARSIWVAASILLIAILCAGPAQAQEFGSQSSITTTANSARSVHAADLDGDGDQDLLAAISGDDTVAWYENFGGEFGSRQVLTDTADNAFVVSAADIDGDGDQDVLFSSIGNNARIAWIENTGGGSFGGENPIGGYAQGIHPSDLDGDGDVDVLLADTAADEVAWLENTGEGFLSRQVLNSNAQRAKDVYTADVDGDGDPDVISAALDGDNVVWQENFGGSEFSAPKVITTNAGGARSVYATDLDGDGDPDVLSASSFDDKIAWYENTGGSFSSQRVITTNISSASVVHSVDADSDGDQDVVSGSFGGTVAWYENFSGEFGAQQVVTTNVDWVTSVFAADLDGDADSDLISASRDDNKIAWYENLGGGGAPPSAPNGLQATGLEGRVELNWDENTESDVLGYHVYRSTSTFFEKASATQINSSLVSTANFSDTNVSPGTNYHYRVTAVDDSENESSLSGEANATPQEETAPSAPTGLQATAGDGQVDLGWDPNTETDLSGYHVYRSTSPFEEVTNATRLTDVLVENASYTDASVSNGTQYYYRVTAVDTGGRESAGSNEASATPEDRTPPAAPTNLQATAGDGQVGLDWDANTEGDLWGYHVYRSTSSFQEVGAATRLTEGPLENASYTDSGVSNGTQYHYRVTAVDTNGNESAGSNEASATPKGPPAAETRDATNVTDAGALLQGRVDPSGLETTVSFEYHPTGQSSQSQTATAQESPLSGNTTQAVSADITGLEPNTEYTFAVIAENSAGSNSGEPRTFTTKRRPPSVSTGNVQNVTVTGAQFNGTVNPNRSETSAVFNYQPTGAGQGATVEAAESPLTGGQPQAIRATVSDLQPDTEYGVQAVATNSAGTQSGETVTFTTPPLEISLSRSAQTPQRGSPFDVTASLTEGFDPTEIARLYYRKVGAPSFQSTAFEETDASTYSATVPASAVTERGVEYYARFSNGTVAASVPESEPSANPLYAPVRVSGLTADGTLEANQYRMISVPLRLDTPDAFEQLRDNFGALDRTVWRLLRWNPEAGSYDEVTTENGSGALVPGRAFWLITRDGETQDGSSTFDVGAGRSVSPEPIPIELPPGWSQIANPRSYPIAWSSVNGRSPVMAPVSYDPSAPGSANFDVQVLNPWVGYWVFNPTDSPVQIGVPPTAAGQAGSVASSAQSGESTSFFDAEVDYSISVEARLERDGGASLRDVHTIMGVGPSGKAGVGVEDVADPPSIGEYLRVDIVEENTRLAGSLRPAGQDGYEWNLTVSASNDEPILGKVEGTLDIGGTLPPGFERRLMDLETGREIPISEGTFAIRLTEEHPTRHLRLIVGTESYTESESADIRPESTTMRAVYPNPSDGPVSVDYQLEEAQRVQIRVYDMLGRVVKTLVDERRPAGHHTVQWNAGAGGTPVASGAYIVRMKTGETSVTQRVSIFR